MNKESLKVELAMYSLPNDERVLLSLDDFVKTTLKANESFNLTAIKDEESFYEKMVLDSALGMTNLDLANKKVIDVGTGAGFPGMVLYIMEPNMNLTLLDSTAKKIRHLENYSKKNNYKISFSNERAEDFARKHREEYDYAFARAVAPLNILLELIVPMLKLRGEFVALKGPGIDEEIKESEKAFKILGLEIVSKDRYILPESKETRYVLRIRKNKETNHKYPRQFNEIKKKPM